MFRSITLLLFLIVFGPDIKPYAQTSSDVTIADTVNTIFPAGRRIESENFTGAVWVERILVIDDAEQPVAVGNVTFPPKSRSHWHHHPAGQSLLVLDGVGYYQQRGKPVRVLRKGQTVRCPPGVEHWHGAANNSWFVQLAMTTEHPDGRVVWGKAVADAEYRAGIAVERAQNNTGRAMNERYRHIATIASLAALGKLDRLRPAFADALDAGLTVNECREVMIHLYAYAGFPRSIRGIQTLMAALEERWERGITDETGADAGAIDGEEAKYARGKAVLDSLVGRTLEGRSAYGDFAPTIDVFLKEHLFADIFERDVLSYRDREIVTVSILSSLDGLEPMLGSHLDIALNLGITEEQLRAVMRVISTTAGPEVSRTAGGLLYGTIALAEQGSFTVGGTVKTAPGTFDPIADGAFNPADQATAGQTLHGDHAFVFFQKPANARPLPLVFWHGYGQSMKTWQTTPDGREGFQTIFLRQRYPVYLLDQPGRGLAGRTTQPGSYAAATDDQLWFGIFRLGIDREFYPGVQFSRDPEALNQFFRQMTPDTGPLDIDLNVAAVSALYDTLGPGVLVTHSHSGGQGWLTALENDNIRAIASYEPGSNFVFPEGEVPAPIDYVGGRLSARGVPMETFRRLTEIPIVIYYGDYIPEEAVENPGREQWRAAVQMARRWTETVNRHGGDVTLVELPEAGLQGNTHFPMSDLNNQAVARLLLDWLAEKGLD